MTAEACCKIGRLISEYDLTPPAFVAGDLDDYLEVRWKGLGQHEPVGFRQLAEWFNKLVLRAAYDEHGREVLDTNLNAEFETLTSSDADVGERAELISDLEEDGIDGDALTDEFVSKSTVRRHLKNCLDAGEKRTDTAGYGNWVGDRVQMSRDQFQKYLQTPLNHLNRSGRLPGASDADLSTPIILTCQHCPTRARLTEALKRGYICEDHFGRAEDADAETAVESQALNEDDKILRPADSVPVDEAWRAFVS